MFISLALPPGIYRNGTQYQSKGRYYDSDKVRWFQGELRPIGGWIAFSANKVSGSARDIITWADNSTVSRMGIGTNTGLFIMDRGGNVYDITPAGFIAGPADGFYGGGYGTGGYGREAYGVTRHITSIINEAAVWQLDTWGQDLIGVMGTDGKIYEWALNTAVKAAPVANAPSCKALVVTNEQILMALGAEGNPRRVKWSDQRDNTNWTPDATNQAGDYDLQTSGRLLCGRRIRGGTLLFTDVDVFLASYLANTLVYGFDRVGSGCGIISRNAVQVLDNQAVWMGREAFFDYNGFVQPLPSDVSDYVFSDINRLQVSKVTSIHNSAFGEVTWYYPSANSTENNRYCTWNYRENHWAIGTLARLCGADRGAFDSPYLLGTDGTVYQHETGYSYGGAVPYARSGPIELGDGERVMHVTQFIGDERTAGDATVTFFARFYPNAAETSFGPYDVNTDPPPTDVRFTARQVEIQYNFVGGDDARIGNVRLQAGAGGKR